MPPERSNRKRPSQSQSPNAPYTSRSKNPPSQLSVTTRLSCGQSGTQAAPMVIAEDSLSPTQQDVPVDSTPNGALPRSDDEDPLATIFCKETTSIPTIGSANCEMLVFLPGEYERLRAIWECRQDRYKAMEDNTKYLEADVDYWETRAEKLEARAEKLEARAKGLDDCVNTLVERLRDRNSEASAYKAKDTVRERNWRDVWDMYERSVNTFRDAMTCPMCYEKTADLATVCGHLFCGGCMATWAAEHDSCPTCRAALDKTQHPTGTIKLHNLSCLRDKGKGIEEGFERLIPHKPVNNGES